MRFTVCLSLSLSTLALLPLSAKAQPAHAASGDKMKAAKRACIAGDFATGVEILSDLYVETGDLNFVFNQGRCFEQNGRYQDAINRFHEYARKLKDAGKPADPDVERHIADCQAMLDKQSGSPVTPRPAPEARTAEAPATPVAVPPPVEVVQAAPAAGTSGAGLRIAGLAAAALGVAGLVTGVVLNLRANQLADDLGRSESSYSRSQDASRSSYETWGWVSYGVGAACLVGGTVLYFVGRSQGSSSQVALVPVAGPGQVGATLQGAF